MDGDLVLGCGGIVCLFYLVWEWYLLFIKKSLRVVFLGDVYGFDRDMGFIMIVI